MIFQKEKASIATEKGVLKPATDKDWALGPFPDAIDLINELREKLSFKGRTCIRKCYISDYRFSEDLDFKSNDQEFRLATEHLTEITELLKDRVEIQNKYPAIRSKKYHLKS